MARSEKILNLKTLIVEDSPLFREVLKEKLQALSCSMVIDEAADGSEALQKVDALKPEIVFMDIRLPDENGIQVTEKIKAKHPNTKIVFLTGYDSSEYREAAIRAGGYCYIPKESLGHINIENLIKALIE
ncbi:MAG TPA: response regulator transcription factor [Thermodesulfobacteriota bacterium]|nr:response regulator transcription factor [Thermodesulfobacteriota bacterium]